MIDDNLLSVAFKVKRAKNRLKVFMAIDESITPSDLVRKIYSKNSEHNFSIVSRALKQLVALEVVRVINPQERMGRIYDVTKLGKKVKAYLEHVKKNT